MLTISLPSRAGHFKTFKHVITLACKIGLACNIASKLAWFWSYLLPGLQIQPSTGVTQCHYLSVSGMLWKLCSSPLYLGATASILNTKTFLKSFCSCLHILGVLSVDNHSKSPQEHWSQGSFLKKICNFLSYFPLYCIIHLTGRTLTKFMFS